MALGIHLNIFQKLKKNKTSKRNTLKCAPNEMNKTSITDMSLKETIVSYI